jgi:hypothetical protein
MLWTDPKMTFCGRTMLKKKDDSDLVESTDIDSVMSDDGESGMEF